MNEQANNQSSTPELELVTLSEAARLVGLSYSGIYTAVRQGRLKVITVPGGLMLVNMEELRSAIREKRICGSRGRRTVGACARL